MHEAGERADNDGAEREDGAGGGGLGAAALALDGRPDLGEARGERAGEEQQRVEGGHVREREPVVHGQVHYAEEEDCAAEVLRDLQ